VSRIAAALLGVAALQLCAPADAIVMRHDRPDAEFIALAKKFPATVRFRGANSSYGMDGMGTLIDARWVLTAGHVASGLAPGDFAMLGGARHEIAAIIQYPGRQELKSWDDVRKDIALVKLQTPVTGIEPALLYTGNDELGMTLTFVGSGRRGTGLTGPVADDMIQRAATNRVQKVEGTGLIFRFDAPTDPEVTALEGISGEGDSGGPAYLERDGKVYLVGVSSAQDSRPTGKKQGLYGVLEHYPRVSPFVGWIRETMQKHR
jgi:hypothetical protein